ncbi:TPM domain-containing protein [Leptospira ilyithenensis]|uniref:YgcG family protein n=1 Tax=Leptospira ilyithenensis TaxID=2484901 RepID=A0A4V6QMR4_9LEPT|nr:YgcG family protein [Leptospira ilyithenensis]TGN06969.1 YgcG family protein [Leptospira ilyithenensis]
MKIYSLVFLLCLSHITSLQAIDVPELSKRVTDRAGILSEETIAKLETKLKAHEESTSNQIAVFTLPSLEGEAIEEIAIQVFDKWKLGQKSKNNGVLFLIAPTERKMRIEVGRGLEGALTDVQAYRIIQKEIKPRFKAGDINGGVEAGVDAIIGTISGEYAPSEDDISTTTTGGTENHAVYLIVAAVILFVGLFMPSIMAGIVTYLFTISIWYQGLIGFFESAVAIFITVAIGIGYLLLKLIGPITGGSGSGGGFYGGGYSSSDDSWSSSSSDDSWSGGGGDSGGGGSSGDW